MRFLFSRDLRDLSHIRIALIFYLICLLLFWGLNWPYEMFSFGLSPESIRLKILGNPEVFASPLSLESLLINIHVRLFLYTLSLLTLSAIYFRLPLKHKTQTLMTSLCYVCVLLNMVGIVLLRYVSDLFLWPKLIGFWGLQTIFGIMIFQGLYHLLLPKKIQAKSR